MRPVIAIPAIFAVVYRAWSHKSLTPLGLVVATLTAVIHAVHPWSAPFALLAVFFLGGTRATKVKHDIKAQLTLSASSGSGGEGPRTHVQVLANSAVASILILLHAYRLTHGWTSPANDPSCWQYGNGVLIVGIVANYAAVAADTFSSELGILSKTRPRLITTLKEVPPGTNGGVTTAGLLAGLFGAFTIAITSVVLLPFCPEGTGEKLGLMGRGWSLQNKLAFVIAVTVWGALGSVLDSVLGALLQASVVDKRTGKIVEGSGGEKVLVDRPSARAAKTDKDSSRAVLAGHDLLDNNQINLLMAASMSVWGMILAGVFWGIPVASLFG